MYMGQPCSAGSLTIEESWALQRPVAVTAVQRCTSNVSLQHTLFQPLTEVVPADMPCRRSGDGGVEFFNDVLARFAWDEPSNDIVCMWLPSAIVELIKRRQWHHLVFEPFRRHSGHVAERLRQDLVWPSEAEWQRLRAQAGSSIPDGAATTLQAQHVGHAKAWLRKHSAAIISEAEDAEATQFELEKVVSVLDTVEARLNGHSPGGATVVCRSAVTFINCLRASFKLRNRNHMAKMADTLVDALVDEHLRDYVRQMMKSAPSGGRISESQVRVDAALSLLWRERLAEHVGPVYLWLDSSPQCGHDWLLSMFDMVAQSEVAKTAHAVRRLQQTVAEFQLAWRADADPDALASIVQERLDCGRVVQANIRRHRQVPVSLGSSASSVEHKCRAIAHKFMNESTSLATCRRTMRQVVCTVADMGTEMAVSNAQGGDVSRYLPVWSRGDRLVMDDGIVFDNPDEQDEWFLPNAMLSSGLDHVSHNLQQELDQKLQKFQPWLKGFKAIVHLLSSKYLRQRFVGRCLLGSQYASYAHLFDKGVPSVAKWRWGTICTVLPLVLSLLGPLRLSWSSEKFGSELSDSDKQTFDLGEVGEAVRDPWWQAYGQMLLELHVLANYISAWGAGCSCHEWLLRSKSTGALSDEAATLHELQAEFGVRPHEFDGELFPCMMRGKRAPELAAGHLDEFVRQTAEASEANILLLICALDEEKQSQILTDIQLGKAYIIMTIELKLGHWTKPPWSLCALAHYDCDRARQAACRILGEFANAPPIPLLHHRITWRWLAPGSKLRCELESFAAGCPMGPALRAEADVLTFIPVVERIQEGEHAVVHRAGSLRKISGAYISCVQRRVELDSFMSDPESQRALCVAFDRVKKLQNLARLFHFSQHPEWCASHGSGQQKGLHKVAVNIMYSTDVASQFLDFTQTRKVHQKRIRAQQSASEKWCSRFDERKRVSEQAVVGALMIKHLQRRLIPGRTYSLPSVLPQFHPLAEALTVSTTSEPPQQLLDAVPAPAMADVAAAAHGDEPQHKVFFRIVCPRPSDLKVVPVAVGSGRRRLRAGQFAVTLHQATRLANGIYCVHGEPTSCSDVGSPVQVLASVSSHPEALQHLESWRSHPTLEYRLPGIAEQSLPTLKQLVKAGAFSADADGLLIDQAATEQLATLEALKSAGFVDSTARGWVFTQRGASTLQVLHHVGDPRLCFELPSHEMSLDEMTEWELVQHMSAKGWSWAKHSQGVLPYRQAGERVWYSRGSQVSKEYLQCLAMADQFFAKYPALLIQHGKGRRYYNDLLKTSGGAGATGLQPQPDASVPSERRLDADVELVLEPMQACRWPYRTEAPSHRGNSPPNVFPRHASSQALLCGPQ